MDAEPGLDRNGTDPARLQRQEDRLELGNRVAPPQLAETAAVATRRAVRKLRGQPLEIPRPVREALQGLAGRRLGRGPGPGAVAPGGKQNVRCRKQFGGPESLRVPVIVVPAGILACGGNCQFPLDQGAYEGVVVALAPPPSSTAASATIPRLAAFWSRSVRMTSASAAAAQASSADRAGWFCASAPIRDAGIAWPLTPPQHHARSTTGTSDACREQAPMACTPPAHPPQHVAHPPAQVLAHVLGGESVEGREIECVRHRGEREPAQQIRHQPAVGEQVLAGSVVHEGTLTRPPVR